MIRRQTMRYALTITVTFATVLPATVANAQAWTETATFQCYDESTGAVLDTSTHEVICSYSGQTVTVDHWCEVDPEDTETDAAPAEAQTYICVGVEEDSPEPIVPEPIVPDDTEDLRLFESVGLFLRGSYDGSGATGLLGFQLRLNLTEIWTANFDGGIALNEGVDLSWGGSVDFVGRLTDWFEIGPVLDVLVVDGTIRSPGVNSWQPGAGVIGRFLIHDHFNVAISATGGPLLRAPDVVKPAARATLEIEIPF